MEFSMIFFKMKASLNIKTNCLTDSPVCHGIMSMMSYSRGEKITNARL